MPLKTNGDLLERINARIDFVTLKLSNHLVTENGCHEYQGQIHSTGYGCFAIYAKSFTPYKRKAFAHRASFAMHFNIDPADNLVCHRCDNRKCINPQHLFLADHDKNMLDMSNKGRSADQKGENNTNNKLSEIDVRKIIARIESGEHDNSIAQDFPVQGRYIGQIRRGRAWQSVANDLDYKPQPVFKRKAS